MNYKYAKIVINNKNDNTDSLYTYRIKEQDLDNIDIGSRVLVPFGIGNKLYEGYVFDLIDFSDINVNKLKYIDKVIENNTVLNNELIKLCIWIKETYLCRYIDAVHCIMPTGSLLKKIQTIRLVKDYEENFKNNYYNFSDEEKKIINYLKNYNEVEYNTVLKNFNKGNTVEAISKLKKYKVIKLYDVFKSNIKPVYQKYIKLKDKNETITFLQKLKNANKQRQVLEYLLENNDILLSEIKKILCVSQTTIKSLEKKNLVEVFTKEKKRIPKNIIEYIDNKVESLTKEQTKAINYITPFIESGKYKSFLIHGVTGSGKTEIYMQIISKIINKNKSAIVLVPEISLTTQIIERFKNRFGNNIAILHSKLSLGERYDEWNRINNGEVSIVIGARSAVFAPLKNLGAIIIDEEHEASYKSDFTPKYNTLDVAEFRAKFNNAVLILGTATPSIETYYKSELLKHDKIELKSRYNNNPLPNIEIVDMREELKLGNKSIFSKKLYDLLNENLINSKQSILFLNRRGHSTFISCRKCGYVLKCPKCDISLTYHANDYKAKCHYCGYEVDPPRICPSCKSKYIKYFGVGTEKVEMIVKKTFPDARVSRLDLDTTTQKGSINKILYDFKKSKIDILIGTQMIAKGLDFPDVTLVGVLAADISLNIPDYRANERTFQLITQVAGRAGRGKEKGKVIVQTYKPEHFIIDIAKNHNYSLFFKNEILLRNEFFYPPFSVIINILFSGEKEYEVKDIAIKFSKKLKYLIDKDKLENKKDILGPHAAPLSKANKLYRWQIIVKCEPVDQKLFKRIINNIKYSKGFIDNSRVNIGIDINPYSLL